MRWQTFPTAEEPAPACMGLLSWRFLSLETAALKTVLGPVPLSQILCCWRLESCQKYFRRESSRIREYPFAAAFLVALLVSAAYRSPVSISVAQAVSFWLAVHCLLRLFPAIISLHPEREYAAVDYAGHVYGALYAGLCGACHLLLNRRACPSAQAWVALVVLTLSTLPREALLYRSD